METCYRHPDRETGVSCSNCGRPICPDCMTTTSVGMRCPECARQKTKTVSPFARQDPALTYVFMGICIAVFIAELATGGTFGEARNSEAALDGAVRKAFVADGDFWRILTAGFLHADITHLLFNMLSLYILGTMLEPEMGRVRFGIVYVVAILAGSLGIIVLDPNGGGLGASGGVFGLMGAGLVLMWARGFSVNPMENGLALWLGLNLFLSFRPGISLAGHLGGLAGGALIALVLFVLAPRLRLRGRAPEMLAVAVGAGVAAASIIAASA